MSISLEEQESIALTSRGDKTVSFFTYEPVWKTRLSKMCMDFPESFRQTGDNGAGGLTFEFPKRLLSVRAPRKRLSEEVRSELSDRLAKVRVK